MSRIAQAEAETARRLQGYKEALERPGDMIIASTKKIEELQEEIASSKNEDFIKFETRGNLYLV